MVFVTVMSSNQYGGNMSQPWTPEPQPGSQNLSQVASSTSESARSLTKHQQWVGLAGLVAAVLAAGAIGFFIGRSGATESPSELAASVSRAAAQDPRLRAAYDTCQSRDTDDTLSIVDEGTSIVVDTRSEYGNPAGMNCVLSEIDTPESILAQVGRTTSLMGVQEADHDGFHLSWSYHPDNGVNMVITDESAA